jgi:hypothetical protein
MWGTVGFISLFLLLFVFLFVSFRKGKEKRTSGPFELQAQKQVADTAASQTVLSETNTGTFVAFVYPLSFQRTGQLAMCSDTQNQKPGEPDCATGRYGLCVCENNDCSPCKHTGYANILNISNVVKLEILTAPDASRQNAASVQLVVRSLRKKSNSSDTETVEETLVLPSLPIQKWTMISIAREGRRFDIYYNNALVLSKRTQYMVDTRSAVGPIIGGDPSLFGKIALSQAFPTKLSSSDISSLYSRLADTNGTPYLAKDEINLSELLPICKGGSCLQGPVVRPASPLLDWETDYA